MAKGHRSLKQGMRLGLDTQKHLLRAGVVRWWRGPWGRQRWQEQGPVNATSWVMSLQFWSLDLSLEAEAFVLHLLALQGQSLIAPALRLVL